MSIPSSNSPSVSLGLIVISTFIALITYGLSLDQSYRYFTCYPKDAISLKLAVVALLLVSTLHVICVMQICWSGVMLNAEGHYTVNALFGLPYFWLLPITTTATNVIARYFFVRRVYLLSGRPFIFYTIAGCALFAAFALCTASAVSTFRTKQITYNPVIILVISELSILIALNLFVNVKLVYELHRARTGIQRTNSLINRIIKSSTHTGVISSILGLTAIALLLASPGLFFQPLVEMLAGFEANAMLFAVNSRRSMVDRGSSGIEIQGVDLDVDVPEDRGRSAISIVWATGHAATDTVATVEFGTLPRDGSPRPRGLNEGPKVGVDL